MAVSERKRNGGESGELGLEGWQGLEDGIKTKQAAAPAIATAAISRSINQLGHISALGRETYHLRKVGLRSLEQEQELEALDIVYLITALRQHLHLVHLSIGTLINRDSPRSLLLANGAFILPFIQKK